MTPGSQWPCISADTWPLASRPDADVGPSWATVARKPSLNGSDSTNTWRSSAALVQHGSEKSNSARPAVTVSSEHSRRAK